MFQTVYVLPGVIAVVKGNAGGYGAITISKHLKSLDIERLAVAIVEEGKELRQAGISGPIHVLGESFQSNTKSVYFS